MRASPLGMIVSLAWPAAFRHAVVALALGRPVHQVSILPDRERLGICEFGKAVFRPSEDWLEREILIALAGLAAEARHTGDYAWDAEGRPMPGQLRPLRTKASLLAA